VSRAAAAEKNAPTLFFHRVRFYRVGQGHRCGVRVDTGRSARARCSSLTCCRSCAISADLSSICGPCCPPPPRDVLNEVVAPCSWDGRRGTAEEERGEVPGPGLGIKARSPLHARFEPPSGKLLVPTGRVTPVKRSTSQKSCCRSAPLICSATAPHLHQSGAQLLRPPAPGLPSSNSAPGPQEPRRKRSCQKDQSPQLVRGRDHEHVSCCGKTLGLAATGSGPRDRSARKDTLSQERVCKRQRRVCLDVDVLILPPSLGNLPVVVVPQPVPRGPTVCHWPRARSGRRSWNCSRWKWSRCTND
jgi:hypothetical protein